MSEGEKLDFFTEQSCSFFLSFLDELPGFNFSFHCHNNISPEYPTLLRCREIEDAIKICQQKGIKILMSLGGTEETQGFSKPADAVLFAYTVYNLLLAGDQMKKLRPFGRLDYLIHT